MQKTAMQKLAHGIRQYVKLGQLNLDMVNEWLSGDRPSPIGAQADWNEAAFNREHKTWSPPLGWKIPEYLRMPPPAFRLGGLNLPNEVPLQIPAQHTVAEPSI